MRLFLCVVSLLLPWGIRRRYLARFFGYDIHPASRIGLAWVFPERMTLEEGAHIGHLTVCKGLEHLWLQKFATIGRGNWITGFPLSNKNHFAHQLDRKPVLYIGEHSAVTNRHIIDCTASVTIGKFSTVAGYRSQILTHSIDLAECRQSSSPVQIGDYCFVATDCVLLGGGVLPDYTVLAAKSLLNKAFEQCYMMYGGVPARPVKELDRGTGYFTRDVGFVK